MTGAKEQVWNQENLVWKLVCDIVGSPILHTIGDKVFMLVTMSRMEQLKDQVEEELRMKR